MKTPERIYCSSRCHIFCKSGFTLLEVMIAVALIAIGFVTLLGSQSKSLSRVTEAKFNTLAPILASTKLAEVESGERPLADDTGDFGADFPDYTWHLVVENVDVLKTKFPAGIDNKLARIVLSVSWSETKFRYSLTSYVRRK
ncbi:MAG: prepilin-type N-terminal cleavage/methylation domain-containing protein [Pseudomonadota bacterium]